MTERPHQCHRGAPAALPFSVDRDGRSDALTTARPPGEPFPAVNDAALISAEQLDVDGRPSDLQCGRGSGPGAGRTSLPRQFPGDVLVPHRHTARTAAPTLPSTPGPVGTRWGAGSKSNAGGQGPVPPSQHFPPHARRVDGGVVTIRTTEGHDRPSRGEK